MRLKPSLFKLTWVCGVALCGAGVSTTWAERPAVAGCMGSALDPSWADCFQQEQQQQYQDMLNQNAIEQQRQYQEYEQQRQDAARSESLNGSGTGQESGLSTYSSTVVHTLVKPLIPILQDFAASKQAFEAKYGKPLFMDTTGIWLMSRDTSMNGKGCEAFFIPASGGSPSSGIGFIGPREQLPGMIIFQGVTIPPIAKPKEVRVVLSTNDASPATVRAILLSASAPTIVVPTDMIATMQGTTETTWVTLQLDGKEVYRSEMAGMMTARDAMLKCMHASK